MSKHITQYELKKLLWYNPYTGLFFWQVHHPTRKINAGDIAGFENEHGYIRIKVNGKAYMAHRLAWLYMKGEYPNKEVDHANCKRNDNRWLNLREATRSQNQANGFAYKNNILGVKGVRVRPNGKYVARIRFNKILRHLGTYDTIKEAHAAYRTAALEHFGEFARVE